MFVQLIYTAKRLSASDAAAIGLVNEAVPAGTAVDKALEVLLCQSMDCVTRCRLQRK